MRDRESEGREGKKGRGFFIFVLLLPGDLRVETNFQMSKRILYFKFLLLLLLGWTVGGCLGDIVMSEIT